MRLHLRLTANRQAVPFSYQHLLTGAFHRWLGPNDAHDALSLYSLSWLRGGQAQRGKLQFPRGATWLVSAHDDALLQKVVNGALREPEVCCGMFVESLEQQAAPDFGARHTFRLASPVLAKGRPDEAGRVRHYLYDDPETDAILTATLRHKMDLAGLPDEHKTAAVRFDREYPRPKTKLVTIKNIQHRASECPVIIAGAPDALRFAWHVGIGNGTGSGFGCIEENKNDA